MVCSRSGVQEMHAVTLLSFRKVICTEFQYQTINSTCRAIRGMAYLSYLTSLN